MSFTEARADVLVTVMKTLNIASLVASFSVAVTYIRFKRRFPQSMIPIIIVALANQINAIKIIRAKNGFETRPEISALWFSVSSFCLHIAILFGPIFGLENLAKNSTACTAQGVAIQYFGSVVTWWFFAIALDLYLIVVHKKDHIQPTLERVLQALCWGVPAIQTIVPFIFHKFEDRLVWCWISQADSGLWELSFFYAIMGVLGIATAYFWLHVLFKIRRVSLMASLTGKTYEYLYRHILSIILFLIVWSIMLADRLYTLITGEVNYWLLLGHIIALSEVGMIDFVCFGFTSDNISRWKLSCRRKYSGESSETQPILTNDSVNYTGGSGTYYN